MSGVSWGVTGTPTHFVENLRETLPPLAAPVEGRPHSKIRRLRSDLATLQQFKDL